MHITIPMWKRISTLFPSLKMTFNVGNSVRSWNNWWWLTWPASQIKGVGPGELSGWECQHAGKKHHKPPNNRGHL